MPILVEVTMTKDEVDKAVTEGIAKFLRSVVPNYRDPATGQAVSYATAIRRGLTAYDYVAVNGALDKRVTLLENRAKTDDADDQAQAAEQDRIEQALSKPILGDR